MSLTINGTSISTSNSIIVNDINVQRVYACDTANATCCLVWNKSNEFDITVSNNNCTKYDIGNLVDACTWETDNYKVCITYSSGNMHNYSWDACKSSTCTPRVSMTVNKCSASDIRVHAYYSTNSTIVTPVLNVGGATGLPLAQLSTKYILVDNCLITGQCETVDFYVPLESGTATVNIGTVSAPIITDWVGSTIYPITVVICDATNTNQLACYNISSTYSTPHTYTCQY